MNTTGYAVYSVATKKNPTAEDFFDRKLVRYGLWDGSKASEGLGGSTLFMRAELECFLKSLDRDHLTIDGAVVETPEIVFSGKKNFQQTLSRVSSILETSFIAGMFWESLRMDDIRVCTLPPRGWQQYRKKSRKVHSKDYSLMMANHILRGVTPTKILHTQKDENIADAITMGELLLAPIFSQQVAFS